MFSEPLEVCEGRVTLELQPGAFSWDYYRLALPRGARVTGSKAEWMEPCSVTQKQAEDRHRQAEAIPAAPYCSAFYLPDFIFLKSSKCGIPKLGSAVL